MFSAEAQLLPSQRAGVAIFSVCHTAAVLSTSRMATMRACLGWTLARRAQDTLSLMNAVGHSPHLHCKVGSSQRRKLWLCPQDVFWRKGM